MTSENQRRELIIDQRAKSFLLRMKPNEYVYALILMMLVIVIFYLFVTKEPISKGIILSAVFFGFLIDFIQRIKKKKFFLQYVLFENSGIKVKVYSWGKVIIDEYFDKSKISAQIVLHKERHVSIELIFQFDKLNVLVQEDTYWNRERMLKLINWLIEDDYLQLNEECKKFLES